MDIHYNAFISYRHHPDDIRVASEIHRLLERFRVPRGVKAKVGKIERLFRDKDELPITSNLTEDITAALRNSDYLIVICSVHTRESVWVQREIETFLQTHSRSQVLTVLCSGEPYDVIPEILLREQVTDPITGEMTWVDVEPLSCDWRLPAKQARQEELPRLAAALLGCGYDHLRQRQRQYRMRRLIAAMSVVLTLSLGFAAYFLYTSIQIQKANVQIQANLDEALRNQSLFLSNAARERLDAGDRLTAIALAMEALPEYPGERPYVPEAEYVLNSALGLYMPEGTAAVGAIGQGGGSLLRNFWVSDYEKLAVVQDDRGVFTTWNTETMEKLATLPIEPYMTENVVFTEKNTVIALSGQFGANAYAVTVEGSLLWKRENCSDMALLEDNTLLLLHNEGVLRELLYVNPETGEEICPRVDLTLPDADMQIYKILAGGAGKEDAVVFSCSSLLENDVAVLLPGEEITKTFDVPVPYVSDALVTEEGNILLMNPRDLNSEAGSYFGNRVTAPQIYDITCYDPETGSILWKQEMKTYCYTGTTVMEQIPQSDMLLCVGGNMMHTLDRHTGEIISGCEAGNGILAVRVESDCTVYALQDGFVGIIYYGEDLCYEVPYMEGNLRHAALRYGMYGLQKDGTQVTVYRAEEKEHLWEMPYGPFSYIGDSWVLGEKMAVSSSGKTYMLDLNRREIQWQQDGYADILGFSQDGSRLWALQSQSTLVSYCVEDGSNTSVEIPEELDGKFYVANYGKVLLGDSLYYMACDQQEAKLVCWNLITDELRTIPLPGEIFRLETEFLFNMDIIGCSEGYFWFCTDERQLYVTDLQNGTTRLVLEADRMPRMICSDGSCTMFAVGSELYLYRGTECTLTLSLGEIQGCSAAIREDDFFVLCDNARVYRYDHSGKLLWETEVDVYTDFASSVGSAEQNDFGWYFLEDNKLMVNALSVATVIDCENWGLCAGIPGFVKYDAEENELVLKSNESLFGCRLYSTEELLELARDQLNGFALSEEERRYYGIN